MTATLAPSAGTETQATWPAILALARFEGRMMVRHPVTWLGALGSVAMAAFRLWEEAPVLNRVSVTLAWTMLPLGAAVALVSGWAVLRAKGRTDAHPPMVMPIAMAQRVGGIVLGLTYPAIGTFALQMSLLGWSMTRDPVTSVVWTEILAGPIYVLFAGAVGAAVTRWMSHPAAPLLSVLVLLGLMIAFPYQQEDWGRNIGIEWLSPLAWPQDIIPYEVAFRPAGLHLGYLTGLTLFVAGVATLGRLNVVWPVLAIGLLVAAILGPAQLGPIGESRRVEAMNRLVGNTAELSCETHHGIDFCAMPGYAGWIEEWAAAIQPVVSVAPIERLKGLEIRQYPAHFTHFYEMDPTTSDWWWIEPAAKDYLARNAIALGSVWAPWTSNNLLHGVSIAAIGCSDRADECLGESAQVVLVWLQAHDSRYAEYLFYDAEHSGSSFVWTCIVTDFWANPDGAEIIRDNWSVLTNPATSYEEASNIMGVSLPTGYDREGHLEGACP